MIAAFEIVAPNFENFYNGWKFCIMSFVLSFNKNHFFKKICY